MKVFISWSGQSSLAAATLLAEAIPVIIQSVTTFISVDDLRKGGRWQADLSTALQSTSIGIICLTRSNLEAPWVMFEAGALSKSVEESSVMPLLIGLNPSDIRPPLGQFNLTKFEKDDFYNLIKTINDLSGEGALQERVLRRSFEQSWPEIESAMKEVISQEEEISKTVGVLKDDPIDIVRKSIDEILTMLRAQSGASALTAAEKRLGIQLKRTWSSTSDPALAISARVIVDLEKRRRRVLTALYQLERLASSITNPALSHRVNLASKELNSAILPIFRGILDVNEADLQDSRGEIADLHITDQDQSSNDEPR